MHDVSGRRGLAGAAGPHAVICAIFWAGEAREPQICAECPPACGTKRPFPTWRGWSNLLSINGRHGLSSAALAPSPRPRTWAFSDCLSDQRSATLPGLPATLRPPQPAQPPVRPQASSLWVSPVPPTAGRSELRAPTLLSWLSRLVGDTATARHPTDRIGVSYVSCSCTCNWSGPRLHMCDETMTTCPCSG